MLIMISAVGMMGCASTGDQALYLIQLKAWKETLKEWKNSVDVFEMKAVDAKQPISVINASIIVRVPAALPPQMPRYERQPSAWAQVAGRLMDVALVVGNSWLWKDALHDTAKYSLGVATVIGKTFTDIGSTPTYNNSNNTTIADSGNPISYENAYNGDYRDIAGEGNANQDNRSNYDNPDNKQNYDNPVYPQVTP